MPSVDINVNQPKDPSTGPGTITGPTESTTTEAELTVDSAITLNPSNWNNYLWPNGRERVIINAAVTLAKGAAGAINTYTVPEGKTLIITNTNYLILDEYTVFNGIDGEIIALVADAINNETYPNVMAFLKEASPGTLRNTTTKAGYKWETPPTAPPDGNVYISGWKIDPALLSDDPTKMVYVDNAGIAGDADLSGKQLTVLGTLVAEGAVTNFNEGTTTISRFDLNGKQVTLAGDGAGIGEITSNAATARLTIPVVATIGTLAAPINVQSDKEIYLNVAGAPGSNLVIDSVRGPGTLVVASTVKQATISGSGNVNFAASQGLTFNTGVGNGFNNTGLTTFDGPVTFDTGAGPNTFAGPVRFTSAVTLESGATTFQKAATFSSLTLADAVTPTFNGATTITALTAPTNPLGGGTLEILGDGDVSINSFNRGTIISLERTDGAGAAIGSISFPWFSPAASLTDDFTLLGDGNITLTTAPLLPSAPGEEKNLIYDGSGILTLNAGANIGRADVIQVTGGGTIKVPVGKNILIGEAGSLPFTGTYPITLAAGTYNGPLSVKANSALGDDTTVFDGETIFRARATGLPIAQLPYGAFNGNVTFDGPIAFTDAAADIITFGGNVIFKDSTNVDVNKIFTVGKDITLYAGKAIEVAGVPVIKAEGNSLVLSAKGAEFTATANTITVDEADITLSSGELVVVAANKFALAAARTLTLNPGTKLSIDPPVVTPPLATATLSFGAGLTLVGGTYNGPLKANDGAVPTIPTIFDGDIVVKADATLPYGTFKGSSTFEAPIEFPAGAGAVFSGDLIFKDDVTVVDTQKFTAAKNITLYDGKAIKVGVDSVIAAKGNLVLAAAPIAPAIGLGAVFTASAGPNTITVGTADIAVVSGDLQVAAAASLGINAVKATLGADAKITLNPTAGLSVVGTGKLIAGNTAITNWTAAGNLLAFVTITPNAISGSGDNVALVGAANSSIMLNPDEFNTNTALELSNVDVRLAVDGSISANSGATATATITLSEGARISGLVGTGASSNDIVVGEPGSPYEFATQTNLEVVDGNNSTPNGHNDNYLHQKDDAAGSATLGVTGSGGIKTLTITNAVPATANGL
jgi:hypothetical protein